MMPMLLAEGVMRPDLLVSTHSHADHLLGLQAVAELAGARGIILSALPDDGASDDLKAIAKRKGIPVRYVSAGDVIWSEPNLTVRVLSPETGWSPGNPDPNQTSLVLRLEYLDFSMLLMADSGEEAENRLARRDALEEADVVKIGHHGSEFGTTSGFLASVHPKLAVISVGRNRYGHPSSGALDRIRSAGAAIHVTRQGGALMLQTNGDTIFWQSFIKPVRSIFDGLYP
jgi:competence protein ComEC